jgi:cysteine desulfurase/selenocysteine lyase
VADMRLDGDLDLGIRDHFPVLARTVDGIPITYLDNAATSLKPQPVIDSVLHYYTRVGANIHRGKHMLSDEASSEYETARARVASYIGAMINEVVFVRNATEGLNILAAGLDLSPEDLVVVSGDFHHSAFLPFFTRCRVATCDVDEHGTIDLAMYVDLLDHRPRAVVLTHCSNVTGVYSPVEEMASLARDSGALVFLDAAQSIPHRRIDVRHLAVDAVVFSAHKMMGPTGIGALYGRAELLEQLRPAYLGGGTVDWVELGRYELRKIPHRFEAGTPDIAAAYGFGAAIDYLERLDPDVLHLHDKALADLMQAEAARRPYLRVIGASDSDRAATMSLEVRGCRRLDEVARLLSDSYGVMCRTGHMCAQPYVSRHSDGQVLRASGYAYNSTADVHTLFEALDTVPAALGL